MILNISNQKMKKFESKSDYFEFAIILVGVVWTVISFQFDYNSDYPAYIKQWSNIVHGGDPYFFANGEFTGNAYGPLHTLITLFYIIHPDLPRMLFSLSWLMAVFLLFRSFRELHLRSWHYIMLFIALILNPFTLRNFIFGINDLLTSSLLFLSLFFMYHGRDRISAWCLAGSILYKFFPIILIPFMLIDNRKLTDFSLKTLLNSVRWNFVSHFMIPFTILYGIHFLLYGDTFVAPFQFLVERGQTATTLSSFSASSLPYFLKFSLGWAFIMDNSFLILFACLILLFVAYLFGKYSLLLVCILSLMMMFLLSRVFSFHYMAGILMILPFYLYRCTPMMREYILLHIYYIMLGGIFIMIFLLEKYTDLPVTNFKGGFYSIPNIFLVIALLAHYFFNQRVIES